MLLTIAALAGGPFFEIVLAYGWIITSRGMQGAAETLAYTLVIVSAPAGGPGQLIGRFCLVGRIGSGGMGEVYRATDTHLGRTVALKLLPARLTGDPERLHRFTQEARAASALNHPNIVTIYDAGVANETPWIAMEFVQGRTLRRMAADGKPTPEQLQRIAVQIAEGLATAHDAGIVHRDLKPENIMVTDSGLVKILDFGIAKLTSPASRRPAGEETELLTEPGMVIGTPGYMSPEQVAGRSVDHRSDQFAFGSIMYEMAAGVNPFRRETAPQTLAAILEMQPRPLREANPDTPVPLSSVIERCLAKDPSQRWNTTSEMAAALGGTGPALGANPRSSRWVAGALAIAAITAVAGLSMWQLRRTPSGPEVPVVAVRTFRDLSADGANNYFSSGIAEEIRGQLSRISSIRLLSRSAVDRYKDGENRKLGTELRATRIVEGSVRIDKGRIRISVQMTDPKSEETVWADQYDRATDDVLRVQGDVALRIASALQTKLTPDEKRRVARRPTSNAAAYDLYLRARKISFGDQKQGPAAIAFLKQAVELDPGFADAMGLIGYRLAYMPDARNIDEALRWSQRAVKSDPDNVLGHNALAVSYSMKGMVSKARIGYLRVMELDPNNEWAMSNLGSSLIDLGDYDEALHWLRLSLERNPAGGPQCAVVVAPILAYGDFPSATKWLDMCSQRHPKSTFLPQFRVVLLATQGRLKEAFTLAQTLRARYPGRIEYAATYADLAAVLGASDAEAAYRDLGNPSVELTFSQWAILPESPRVRLAWFALQRKDSASARRLLEEAERAALKLWDDGVESSLLPVELAAVYSLRGNREQAMTWMQRAFDRGWRHHYSSAIDPMLRNLHTDPRFQQLLTRMKNDVARMRKDSTELQALFEKTVPALPPVPKS